MFCGHGLEDSTQLKYPYYPKQFTDLMQYPPKSQCHFFKEIEQKNHQICMESEKTPNRQSNPEKKE